MELPRHNLRYTATLFRGNATPCILMQHSLGEKLLLVYFHYFVFLGNSFKILGKGYLWYDFIPIITGKSP